MRARTDDDSGMDDHTLSSLLAMTDAPSRMQWRALQEGVKSLQNIRKLALKENADLKQQLTQSKVTARAAASSARIRPQAPIARPTAAKRTYAPVAVEAVQSDSDAASM